MPEPRRNPISRGNDSNSDHPPRTDVVYQDDDLLVIHKPAGLLSVADGYNPNLAHIRTVYEPEFGPLWIIHRLDRDTSGLLICARHAEAHRLLNAAFREHRIQKIYHGLAYPQPQWREISLDSPLAVDADRQHRTRVDYVNGKPASTRFFVMKVFSTGVLLSIEIETGITHQIRAHLRSMDMALWGDKLYQAGLPEPEISAPRTMLHARTLSFLHPVTGESLRFSAPYPADFRDFYTKVRRMSGRHATGWDEAL